MIPKHTKGPWAWFSQNGKPYLATPHSGQLLILDAVRHGTSGAILRFAKRTDSMGGIMLKASEIDIDLHPDAALIKSSPDLYRELLFVRDGIVKHADPVELASYLQASLVHIQCALEKAEGQRL